MNRSFLSLLLAFLCIAPLFAQGEKYDPYAVVKEDPPITADGKINWPPYFKSAATEDRFQGYFATGSCVGTNMRIVNKLKDNKLDVNAFPAVNISLQVSGIQAGALGIDATGQTFGILTHPKGVSKIEVSGQIPAESVVAGMFVRFQGKVDDHAQGVTPIENLEVFTPTADTKPIEVVAGKLQTIVGRVERRKNEMLRVNVGNGKLRLLTFKLPDDANVQVNGQSLDLVAAGDEVSVEGKIYTTGNVRTVFGEKLVVKKPQMTAQTSSH